MHQRCDHDVQSAFAGSIKSHGINDTVAQLVEKVQHSWAFSHLYGKISMGDQRCLNEGSWIAES